MCDTCGDTGFYRMDVPFGDPQFGKLIRCACTKNSDAALLQNLSGLTDSERKISLCNINIIDRPGTALMVRACQNFIECPNGIVTFWGGSGNAKTLALQAVVNHFVTANTQAVYITAFDLISYIRSAFNKDRDVIDDNAYSRLVRFEHVRILAIDEMDKVNATNWVQEQLTDLIDKRYRLGQDKKTGTLIAMNDNPRELPSWIYSRLAQNLIVHNPDEDVRPELGAHTYSMFSEMETEILE